MAGNVIENQGIDLVLVGANGFDTTCFKHSAGHGTIIKLAREHRQHLQEGEPTKPQIVLVVSTDKWGPAVTKGAVSTTRAEAGTALNSEGYPFWQDGTGAATRNQTWFTRDERLFGELKREAEDDGTEVDIVLFNPREDVMPIEGVDCIISDAGFHLIADSTAGARKQTVAAFLEEIQRLRHSPSTHGGTH